MLEVAAEEQQGNEEQEKLRRAYAKRIRQMQIEQQKRELARKVLTPEAYERLMNVRMANGDVYSQLIDLVISLAQSGRATGRITEEQLKSILAKLTYRPETKIEYKHK